MKTDHAISLKNQINNGHSLKHITKALLLAVFVCTLLFAGLYANKTVSYAKNSFTVKTSTKPCNKDYKKLKTYNKKTKQYYMLRSYLEKLEKNGGGTLTLKKGTYSVPCTLYVPSNVTIVLKSGVTIKKTSKTGTKKLTADSSLFELVPPSKSAKNHKIKKYKSSKSVTIKGSGTACINLNNVAGSTGIVMGHNNTVTVSGITFKKMNGGSYITAAASKKVTISGCTFSGHTATADLSGKYAIRLEVPDAKIETFTYTLSINNGTPQTYVWSKYDGTPNYNIKIKNNVFTNLDSAIGTVKYAEKIYQNKISIGGNTFSGITDIGIRVLNWNAPTITGNTFTNMPNGVIASGALSPSISQNVFDGVNTPIQFTVVKNSGSGSEYAATTNSVGAAYVSLLEKNTVRNAGIYYIPYEDTTGSVRLAYYPDMTKDFVLTPGGPTFQGKYTDNKWYNSNTHDYYMFKSYLEQLEATGGGTITVSAGVYSITNTLYVPSNTKIIFKDGAVLNKGTNTGFSSTVLAPSISVFQLVPPSKSTVVASVGGYEGSHDITFIGEGTVLWDMLFYENAKAIVMCHNTNITVRNINFRNYFGHHFIEMDASKNVLIEGCSFVGSKYTGDSNDYKEAINLDTPDKNTGGFNQLWTNYDRTPNLNVIIQNNEFTDTLRAIGTHNYSVSPLDGATQVYHTNVQILNNTITNTNSYAIRAINWKDCIIRGNTIKNLKDGESTAILLSGSVNPTVTKNTIENASKPITLNSSIKSNVNRADYTYPKTDMILDSTDKTGKNISDMLDNMLIDVKTTTLTYYVGGTNKSTSTQTLKFKYDSDHIQYTKPTPTPDPEGTPEPEDPDEPEEPTEPAETPAPLEQEPTAEP